VSVGAAFRHLGRAIGIVRIFSIVGPLAFATLILRIVAGFGAPLMAWLAVALAIIGVIVLRVFFIPDESSAVILPSARSAAETISLFAVLAVLAILPTTLCWWLAKPLHRANIAA
jgi:hypothetical protein